MSPALTAPVDLRVIVARVVVASVDSSVGHLTSCAPDTSRAGHESRITRRNVSAALAVYKYALTSGGMSKREIFGPNSLDPA